MKSLKDFLFEGADLRCSNCGDNLGKATENSVSAHCGTCGHKTKNPNGYKIESQPTAREKNTEGKKEYPKINMSPRKPENSSGKTFKINAKETSHKYVNHGNGTFSHTSPYKPHDEYGKSKISRARTTFYHISGQGYSWNSGSIEHIKHHDGKETHTLELRPSNHTYSGGSVKSLKDAADMIHSARVNHQKATGYYKKDEDDHGHGIEFKKNA